MRFTTSQGLFPRLDGTPTIATAHTAHLHSGPVTVLTVDGLVLYRVGDDEYTMRPSHYGHHLLCGFYGLDEQAA